jgi:flagellar motor switch protein FliN/FliY
MVSQGCRSIVAHRAPDFCLIAFICNAPLLARTGPKVLPLDNVTLDSVSLDITVVLGTTSMPVHQVLRLGRGAIIELDASEEDEVTILANNLPVAKGNVVVNGNRIAVEIKEWLARPA